MTKSSANTASVQTEKPLHKALPTPPFTAPNPPNPQSLAPKTTAQEDVVTAGQRKINLIWEITQAIIAVSITVAIIFAALSSKSSSELSNAFFLIVGFYFSRTNHTNIGGVGEKPTLNYKGR